MPRQLPPPLSWIEMHNKTQKMSCRYRRWIFEGRLLYTLAVESAASCLEIDRHCRGDIEVRKMNLPQSGTHLHSNLSWTGLRPQKRKEKTKEKGMLKRTKMASSAW